MTCVVVFETITPSKVQNDVSLHLGKLCGAELENAFDAIRHGVREVIITRADAIGQENEGTRIVG